MTIIMKNEHEGHNDHDDDGHKDDDHDDHGHKDHHGHEDEHEGHNDHDDGHKDDDHDDHGHKDHHGHEDEDDDSGHDGHGHGEFDAHIWLDPMNAIFMVAAIADELSELDPTNEPTYHKNSKNDSIDRRPTDRVNDIVPLKPSYIVFHDAYQYFEYRFKIKAAGALTLNPDVLPEQNR